MSVSGEVRDPRARPANYRRPELLDRVPPSFVTSSGVYAAAAGVVLLYGLVLAAAMPGIKASLKPKPPQVVQNPTPTPPPSTHLVPTPGREGQGRNDPIQKPDGAAAITSIEPPKPPEPPPTPAAKVETKTQVAMVSPTPVPEVKPAPVKVEPPKPALDFKALKKWTDPTGKAQWVAEDEGMTLKVPGKFCFLIPPAGLNTSPRAVAEVEGDFDVQVKVVGDAKGELKPGSDPVKNAPVFNGMPIAFNGVGLLVWQGEGSFIRLERAVWTQNGRNFFPQVVCEVWMGGQLIGGAVPDVPGAGSPLGLRIQRLGGTFICSYSLDDKAWLEVKRQEAGFDTKVEVGVMASNTSRKAFAARLDAFSVARGAGGPK